MTTHDEARPEQRIGTPSSSCDRAPCSAQNGSPTRPPHRKSDDAEP